jgi:hypothetical protein
LRRKKGNQPQITQIDTDEKGFDEREDKQSHHEKASEAIATIRAIKAAKTTSRLNLRIRFSYACAQSMSSPFAGGWFTEATNRSVFTILVLPTAESGGNGKFTCRKTTFIAVMEKLKKPNVSD